MKRKMHGLRQLLALLISATSAVAQANSDSTVYPGQDRTWQFHDAAGTSDSTAVWKNNSAIEAWATGSTNVQYGSNVDAQWRTPEKALGPAMGDSFDVVVLGRGGQITMTFENPITNGSGFDFVVFENSFNDTFLELAWVEVSTDGTHFTRFPNFSYTASASNSIDPRNIHGLASKYRQGYGTPFDLSQLQFAYNAAIADTDNFASAYEASLEANFPHLDLDEINYVRLVDIVGDGTDFDAEGFEIFDPYPTIGSAGFDLDAVGVLNEAEPESVPQTISFSTIENQLLSTGTLELSASASSSLPVSYEVLSGSASLEGNVLTFIGVGEVQIEASQSGSAEFDPATPVVRSFYIVEGFLEQHIYFEPVSNQIINQSGIPLFASTSSGLSASLTVISSPAGVGISGGNSMNVGSQTGRVVLSASQSGGYLDGIYYNAADSVSYSFDVVDSGADGAPIAFAEWLLENSIAGDGSGNSDGDLASDFEEYVIGRSPVESSNGAVFEFEYGSDDSEFVLSVSRRAPVRVRLFESDQLGAAANWIETTPRIMSIVGNEISEPPTQIITLQVPSEEDQVFWRFEFESLE